MGGSGLAMTKSNCQQNSRNPYVGIIGDPKMPPYDLFSRCSGGTTGQGPSSISIKPGEGNCSRRQSRGRYGARHVNIQLSSKHQKFPYRDPQMTPYDLFARCSDRISGQFPSSALIKPGEGNNSKPQSRGRSGISPSQHPNDSRSYHSGPPNAPYDPLARCSGRISGQGPFSTSIKPGGGHLRRNQARGRSA